MRQQLINIWIQIHYKQQSKQQSKQSLQTIKTTILSMIKNEKKHKRISKTTASKIYPPKNSKLGTFYILPKLHKTKFKLNSVPLGCLHLKRTVPCCFASFTEISVSNLEMIDAVWAEYSNVFVLKKLLKLWPKAY
jgi:hypothetical protein